MGNIAQVKQQIRLQEWAQEIEACQASGLTVAEWCKKNNIKTKNYYYHLKVVREHSLATLPEELKAKMQEETKSEPVVFKKLEVEEPVAKTTAPIVIHLKDSIVVVPSGMSSETLEAVLLALKKYAG